VIKSLNKKTSSLVETVPGVEDFEVMPDGSIIMAKGSKLYRWKNRDSNEWKEIADFGVYNLFNITRLALRNGKLALVNKEDL